MVRKKSHNPVQLGETQQKEKNWDLATANLPVASSQPQESSDAAASSASCSGTSFPSMLRGESTTDNNGPLVRFGNGNEILTLDSDDSTSDIQEVSIIQPILKYRTSNRKSASPKKHAKTVLFQLSDASESSDDDYLPPEEEYFPVKRKQPRKRNISSARTSSHCRNEGHSDDDNLSSSNIADDGIEFLGTSVISNFDSDAVILEYDGYEVAEKAKQRKKRGEIQYYGEFEKVLDECILNTKIFRDEAVQNTCLFSQVKFVLCEDIDSSLWEKTDNCWLYICPDIDRSAIYFEWISEKGHRKMKRRIKSSIAKADSFIHYKVSGFVNDALWRGFSSNKYFHLTFNSFNTETKEVCVDVYLMQSALRKLQYPSEVVRPYIGIPDTVSLLFNIDVPVYTGQKKLKHDYEVMFRYIRNAHEGKIYLEESVQHPALIPMLRPYQQSAVQWMLYKENVSSRADEDEKLNMHCLFVELTAYDGTKLYYNKYGGYFTKEMPLEILATPGGILADEMGLGKTVEVLACILNNPSPPMQKPDYLEPIIVDDSSGKRSRKKKKRLAKTDIITLADCSSDSDANSEISIQSDDASATSDEYVLQPKKKKRKSSSDSDDDYDVKEDMKTLRRSSSVKFNDRITDEGGHISDNEDTKNNETSRPKRNCKIRRFSYSDMDDFCYDSISSLEDGSLSKVTKHRQKRRSSTDDLNTASSTENGSLQEIPPPPKRFKSVADEEIERNPFWKTIESVIVERCWNNKLASYKKEGSYSEFRKYLREVKKDPTYMMTMRERLQLTYEQATTTYSSAGAVNKNYHKNFRQSFFKSKVEQKTYFECICGGGEFSGGVGGCVVQCSVCGLHQHAQCVEYDTTLPYRGAYVCPHCWTQQPPVSSGATLIVTPSSITCQWVEEIKKHVRQKALKLLLYRGVHHQGYVQPRTLAAFDLVITSYETLSRELNYVDLPHSNSQQGRRFRHPKRFMAVPTPLLSIEWWRCVLDEAQMVEATTARTAQLALRVQARHRWCVTGTPLQRSIDDIQGLLLFLGIDPWSEMTWWSRVLYEGYCHGDTAPLHRLMAQVMWRRTKKDVIDQIQLPPQTETIHWVQFGGVEEHFYRQLHSECSKDARARLSKFADCVRLSDLDRKTLAHLLQPLLRLRQACNHPQIVKGAFTRVNQNKPLSMVEVMERLVERTKVQAEDAHRIVVKAKNGLAAVLVIREQWEQAVLMYRDVLSSANEYVQHFKTDSLQRLHALYNLNELLSAGHSGLPRTIADDELPTQVSTIKNKYLEVYSIKVSEVMLECEQTTQHVLDLEGQRHSKGDWWLAALQSFNDEFVQEVRDELLSRFSRFEENKCVLYHVLSKPQLKSTLLTRTKMLSKQRHFMLDGVRCLADAQPTDLVEAAIDCHLRPTERNPPQCKICAIHELFLDYEKNLFFMTDKKHLRTTDRSQETADVKEKAQIKEATRKGNWGQSEVERVLKYLQTRSLNRVTIQVSEDAQTHMKVLDLMKKEFKSWRLYWQHIFDRVSGLDEVNMATLRLRIRYPDEQRPPKQIKKKDNEGENLLDNQVEAPKYVLEEEEVALEEIKFKSERIVYENDLNVKLGKLLYLQNLQKKNNSEENNGKNPEPCPICQSALGEEWAVLLCGHCFCRSCITFISKKMLVGLSKGTVKCPMCRQPTMIRDISHVDTKASAKYEEVADVKVIGSLSSKTEEVVRVMLRIKAEDAKAKVLVFSSWNEVLDVIADGLAQNGIPYRLLQKGNKFQVHLSAFKNRSEITALLLPITSGANGLNLTEARHVFLVDPLLNPAAELQAVGRIHRMGQTQSTVVHRFLVRGTIEHRMYRILGSLHKYTGKREEQKDKSIEIPQKDDAKLEIDSLASHSTSQTQLCETEKRSSCLRRQITNENDGPSNANSNNEECNVSEENERSEGDESENQISEDATKENEGSSDDMDQVTVTSSAGDEHSLTIGDLKQLFVFTDVAPAAGSVDVAAGAVNAAAGPVDAETGAVDTAAGPADAETGAVDTAAGAIDAAAGSSGAAAGPVDAIPGSVDASACLFNKPVSLISATTEPVKPVDASISTCLKAAIVASGTYTELVTTRAEPVADLSKPVTDLSKPVTGLSIPVTDLSKSVTDLSKSVTDLSKPVTDLSKPVTDLSKPVTDLSKPVTDLSKPVADLSKPVTDLSKSVTDLSKSVADLSKSVTDLLKPVTDLYGSATDSTEPETNPIESVIVATGPVTGPTEPVSVPTEPLIGATAPVTVPERPVL